MRAQLRLGLTRLFAGRTRKAVFAEIAAVCSMLPVMWLAACAFVLLEPLT